MNIFCPLKIKKEMTKTTLDENSYKIWEQVNGAFKLQNKWAAKSPGKIYLL